MCLLCCATNRSFHNQSLMQSPLVGTIQVKFTNYFNTFQTDFFWSIAEIREKTISEDFEVTSQVTVLVTFSKIKTTTESVSCQRPFISFASLLPAPISSVAPFHWICAITLTADKNSEYLWQTNPRLAHNEQLVVYTPSFKTSMPKFALEKLR